MPRANRSWRPLCSPCPWISARVSLSSGTGQALYASLVPSGELMNPLAAAAVSGAKVAESAEDLERLLLRFEQGRRVSADPAQRIRPFRAAWALGVQPESGSVKENALALHLLNHWSLGEHVLERLAAGKAPTFEIDVSQLSERVVIVPNRGSNVVVRTQFAHEDREAT